MYKPINYKLISLASEYYKPSSKKMYNNDAFDFWERSLFQRAASVFEFDLPEQWGGEVKDFFKYCLFRFGYVAVFYSDRYGYIFQPAQLSGYNIYYQYTEAIISNPVFDSQRLIIGEDCEVIKLTPDYMGVWDIISYYAEKLATLDSAVDMALTNSKMAYILAAKNKASAEALKKILDKVNRGEPTVIYDSRLSNDPEDGKEPWHFLERKSIKESYITTDLLRDFATLLNNFDAEIGIPSLPYEKRERLVKSEAEMRSVDGVSRSLVWFDSLTESIDKVNNMFPDQTPIRVYRRFDNTAEEGDDNEEHDNRV